MSTTPRNAPTATETAITMMVSRTVSSRVGHVTRRSSPMTSPTMRTLNARRATCPLTRRAAPGSLAILSHLAVENVLAAARAVLVQLQPVRVVAPIFARVVSALSALRAAERYEYSDFASARHVAIRSRVCVPIGLERRGGRAGCPSARHRRRVSNRLSRLSPRSRPSCRPRGRRSEAGRPAPPA